MGMTNYGAQAIIWQIGSNLSNNYIQYYNIGSGSGATTVTSTTLISESGTRAAITGSPNFDTARKVTFTGDYNSVQISGLNLREFGLIASGAVLVGSTWFREAFPSVTFDGSNELQMATTIEVIPG